MDFFKPLFYCALRPIGCTGCRSVIQWYFIESILSIEKYNSQHNETSVVTVIPKVFSIIGKIALFKLVFIMYCFSPHIHTY